MSTSINFKSQALVFAVWLSVAACGYKPPVITPSTEQLGIRLARQTPMAISTAALLTTPTAEVYYYDLPTDWTNPVRIALGDTTVLHHGGFAISFIEVLEDSRCRYSLGQVCKWEGNAQILLRVKRAEDSMWTDITLNTNELPRGKPRGIRLIGPRWRVRAT